MTREKAIKIVKEFISGTYLHLVDQEALETLIPELKESEDDRMIRLLRKLGSLDAAEELYEEFDLSYVKVVYWLAKRSVNNEYVFRPSAGTDITIAAEQAIRRTKEGDHLVLAFNGVYLPVRKYNNAKELVDEYDACIEKQKDASKAIEAVERIDKYIDEHVANAHDMKDSNPDKKYYRGWDDALGKMAGILQDVYSGKKQKENSTDKEHKSDVEELREILLEIEKELDDERIMENIRLALLSVDDAFWATHDITVKEAIDWFESIKSQNFLIMTNIKQFLSKHLIDCMYLNKN